MHTWQAIKYKQNFSKTPIETDLIKVAEITKILHALTTELCWRGQEKKVWNARSQQVDTIRGCKMLMTWPL